MAEKDLNHLNYGQFGSATFDLESRDWSFTRDATITTLKRITTYHEDQATTTVVPASVHFPSSAISTRVADTNENVKYLLRNHPEIVPASDLLSDLAITSAAVLSTASVYDPLVGELLSLGSVTSGRARTKDSKKRNSDSFSKTENPRRIAAMVTGEAGNVLRLALFYKATHGWGDDRSVWLRGETLKDTESGYWNDQAAPIQQVCFAQSEEKSALLAVRLPTRTVLFRPRYSHQRPQPAAGSAHYDLPSSLIDAHPILSLDIEETGGSSHADVAFNPEFQLQFAVVDTSATWSIWDIEKGRKGDKYSMSCSLQGYITPPEATDLAGEDGWARVLWAGDVNTILVCNRRHLSIIDITGGTSSYLPSPTIFGHRSSDWILDVKRHPTTKSGFFILTSSSLFLMAVTTSSDALGGTSGEVGAFVLLSWKHYRGAEDFTLHMSVQMLEEDESCVLLHSFLNNLVQTYKLHNSPGTSNIVSVSSPTMLDLTIEGPQAGHITQLHMDLLRFRGAVASDTPGPGHAYASRRLQFYKLCALRSDLSIHEMILHSHDGPCDATSATSEPIQEIRWTSVYRPRKDSRPVREMDDFVQPASAQVTDGPIPKFALQVPKWVEGQASSTRRRDTDHTLLYDALTQYPVDGDGEITSTDVAVVARQIRHMLHGEDASSTLPIGTLLDFAGASIEVSDVDEASTLLHNLTFVDGPDKRAEARSIARSGILHLTDDEESTVSTLYDTILQNWVAPLPQDVPTRVRQRKERLARRLATEVMLASTRVRTQDTQALAQPSQPLPSQDSGVSLPILPSRPAQGSPARSSQVLFTQSSLPLMSHLQSSPLLPLSAPLVTTNPLERLRKHLTIHKGDVTDSAVLPSSVNQLLAHWQPGTDPHEYDWATTEHTLHSQNLLEVSQENTDKARKKRERRVRKQMREDELMRSQPSSQPFVFRQPVAIVGSSPGPALASSSQVPSQPFSQPQLQDSGIQSQAGVQPQSQIEPGRFGGRLDKKKKKKRVGGF